MFHFKCLPERSMPDTRVGRTIGICKKVVGTFSNSFKLRNALVVAQDKLKLTEHKLITESTNKTWLKAAHDREIHRARKSHLSCARCKKCRYLLPTWQDVDVLKSLSKALSPLLEFTDALSGAHVITIK